jgi:hypothetical protein
VSANASEPTSATGAHCTQPFECGFYLPLPFQEPQAEHPSTGCRAPARRCETCHGATRPVKCVMCPMTCSTRCNCGSRRHAVGKPFFDRERAPQALSGHKLPAYFMDFESIQFAVPIWAGTQALSAGVPFSSACTGWTPRQANHTAFLDLSGNNPSKRVCRGIWLQACGTKAPVFVYNAAFETRPASANWPSALPTWPNTCWHQRACGGSAAHRAASTTTTPASRAVGASRPCCLPLCPDLKYSDLDGVQDGGMAMAAYAQAIQPGTTPERRREIRRQLLAYCQLDTLAMVRLWGVFSGADR